MATLINVVVMVCRRKKTNSVCAHVRLPSGFYCDEHAFTYDDIVLNVRGRQKHRVTTKAIV